MSGYKEHSPFNFMLTERQLADAIGADPSCGELFLKVAEAVSSGNASGSDMFDAQSKFDRIKTSAIDGIKEAFPVEGKKHRIELLDVWVEDRLATDDYVSQQKAKMKDRTFSVPMYGKVRMTTLDGKVLDEVKKVKLTDIPKITSRNTFIVKGSEWTVPTQLRLKPGVYTVPQANGLPKTQINMGKGGRGRRMEIHLDPEKQRMQLKVNNSHIPLYPILRAMGKTHQDISKAWGEDLADINQDMYGNKQTASVRKFAEKWLDSDKDLSKADAIEALQEQFEKTELSEETTKTTLHKAYAGVDTDLLTAASGKLVRVQNGTAEHDDRDHLRLKSVHSVEDIFKERFVVGKRQIHGKIKRQLDQKTTVKEVLSSQHLKKMTEGIFTGLVISERSEQYNPIHLLNESRKTTLMGEGALGSLEMVKDEARSLHPSHLGFLDPIKTPESAKIGVVNFMTTGTEKVGDSFVARYLHAKTGMEEKLTPTVSHEKKIAFPDQFELKNGKVKFLSGNVKVQYKGQVEVVPKSEVDYVLPSAGSMFTHATARVPYLGSMSGGRAFMASKHAEQALPLVNPDTPLVLAGIGEGRTVEHEVGESFAATSPITGEVVKVTKDHIFVKGKGKGAPAKVSLYNNFKLNEKSFFNHTPSVKVGDKVKKNAIVADMNFTKNGVLSMGKNTIIAYMPESGMTIEDGIVVSESYSSGMTHEEIVEVTAPKGENFIYSKKEYSSNYPGAMSNQQALKLDSRGVVKVGQVLNYGDVIVAMMRLQEDTSEDRIFRKLGRGLTRPVKDVSVSWTKSAPGEVIAVDETIRQVKIHVKMNKKLQVADKLAGSYGNKGVVSEVRPDHLMPKNKDGRAVDMIFNPLGIVNRINPGQMFEAKMGQVANKDGKTKIVENFRDISNWEDVNNELNSFGIAQTEELFDGKGDSLGEISTGNGYIFKLSKTADSGFSARSYGEGYDLNGQPLSGGETGSKSVDALTNWSLVAHGGKNLLREMASHKSERNDEFWRAVQTGQQVPAPKVPFAWTKFGELLKTSGINMKKNGSVLMLEPFMDEDIIAMSSGEITDAKMLRGKGLKEHKNGLFDQDLTGGVKGNKSTHMMLAEPMPNPVFRDPIKKLTGINDNTFQGIVDGKTFISQKGGILGSWDDLEEMSEEDLLSSTGIEHKAYAKEQGKTSKDKILNALRDPSNKYVNTGGIGMRDLLRSVDIEKKREEFTGMAKRKKGSERNSANRSLRYISGLEKMGIKADEAYMQQAVYVPPPVFRPVYQLESGDLGVSPLNYLYRDINMVSNQLKESNDLDDDLKQELRASLYQGMEALSGVSGAKPLTRPAKGALHLIAGDNPKRGFFQRTLLRKQQDLAGRGVAVPNPNLDIDEVAIPKKMAKQLFRPFITQKLIKQHGLSASDAVKRINDDSDPLVNKALDEAMRERDVLLNRAPSLHKYSIQSFKPVLTSGKQIETNTLIHPGFNLDHDGDQLNVHIPVTHEAQMDAMAMRPSAILRSPARIGDDAVSNYIPFHMTAQGIYNMTKSVGRNKASRSYSSAQDILEDVDSKKISYSTSVKFLGVVTTAGRAIINDKIPKEYRDYNATWTKKRVQSLAATMSLKNSKQAANTLSQLQKLGDRASGSETMTMQDLKPSSSKQRTLALAKMKTISINKDMSRTERSNAMLDIVEKELVPAVEKDARVRDIAFMRWIDGGAAGGKGYGAAMQHISGPTIVTDYKKVPIPVPVMNSYSEGLAPSDYFNAAYGARGGMIGRALATAQPGYRNKLLLSAVGDQLILGNDCGDKEGINMDLSDSHVIDRFEVGTHKLVTPSLVAERRKEKKTSITVRSPISCKNSNGICKMCYGPNENGTLYEDGVNIGAIAGQSMGEPLTQSAMSSFHTGGVLWKQPPSHIQRVSSFKRIQQLTGMPMDLADKSPLAKLDGNVTDVTKDAAGGWRIFIDDNEHWGTPGTDPVVKKGDAVRRGQPLSNGLVDPRDVLKEKGLRSTQKFLTEELHKAYAQPSLKKKNFEVVVRSLTNTGIVQNPGSNSAYNVGDMIPLSVAYDMNKNPVKSVRSEEAIGFPLEGAQYGFAGGHVVSPEDLIVIGGKNVMIKRDKVDYRPELLGVGQIPHAKTDFVAALGQERLRQTLMEGAATGAMADIHGSSPTTAFAYGAEYGRGQGGRY